MAKNSISAVSTPFVKHDAIIAYKNGKSVPVRIMLVKYDGVIEVYYQEQGYPFEFAYGISENMKAMAQHIAHVNVYDYLHYEED